MKSLISNLTCLVVFFGLSFFLDSCKKCNDRSNPDCENYDPCYNFIPVNADFSINEYLDLGDNDTMYSETDTILNINPVVFKPRNTNQKITWIIGSERLEQKIFYRQNFPLGWIDVTMIAEIEKSDCSNNKKLIDTVHKRFYVQSFTSKDSNTVKRLKLFGTWQGYNTDNPSDLFKISFGYIRSFFGAPVKYEAGMDLAGLPKGCPSQYDFYQNKNSVMPQVLYTTGFRSQLIKSDGSHSEEGGFNIVAKCRVLNNDILHIDYSYNDRPYQNYLKKEKQIVEPIIPINKKWIGAKFSNNVILLK